MQRNPWFLAVLSALLLVLFWPAALYPLPGAEFVPPLGVLVGFVPLMLLERSLRDQRKGGWKLFGFAFLAMALFNLGTTWWVAGAHWSGVAATVTINGSLMAGAWAGYAFAARRGGERMAFWTLASLWLALEQLHAHWDVAFPWLDLGHSMATVPWAVQWYAFTGPAGGTVWILAINAAVAVAMQNGTESSGLRRWHLPVLLLAGPLALSGVLWTQKGDGAQAEPPLTARVAVVQPNLDPYTEKFELPELWQVSQTLDRLKKDRPANAPALDWVVFPETFLPSGLEEDRLQTSAALKPLMDYSKATGSNLMLGATTYALVDEPSDASRATGDGRWYETYNSSLWLDSSGLRGTYHKSKLVVGVERMPFIGYLKPLLGDAAIALGGTSGTLGTQHQREVFGDRPGLLRAAPVICWEQDFSDYVTDYVRLGANFLAVQTNDGWWGNTPGHIQHLHYARLRAVETGLWVVRSANTGVSAIIDHRGTVLQRLDWDRAGHLEASVPDVRNEPTYYSRSGNYLGGMSVWLAPLLLLSVWVKTRTKR